MNYVNYLQPKERILSLVDSDKDMFSKGVDH